MAILIAPTEPSRLKAIGTVSSVPETFGADIMWSCAQVGGLVGVQRKELRDLIASVHDGRLAKEVQQLSRVAYACLIVEGQPRWTNDGALVDPYTKWTKHSHRSLLRSVQARGIEVCVSDSVTDTVMAVMELAEYLKKETHDALDRRPKPRGEWGDPTEKDFAMHVLQSAPGVGPKMAGAIYDHFDGVPIGWTITRDELEEVAGIGPGRASKLWRTFNSVLSENDSAPSTQETPSS